MSTSVQAASAFVSKFVSKAIQAEELAAAHYLRLSTTYQCESPDGWRQSSA
jgi:hypothetical protein